MDYQYAPPPPPPPRRYHVERVHHFNDAYYPYNRDYVEKKRKIGLLAGMSLTSLGAGIIGGHLIAGAGAVLAVPAALGIVGLGIASVLAVKAALSKKVAPPPPPEEVIYEDIGYRR